MKCKQIQDQLSSYLENELSSQNKAFVEHHLKICQECSSLYIYLKEIRFSMESFPEIDVSENLSRRLYVIPKKSMEKKKKRFIRFDFLTTPSLQPVFAAASILMILVSLYTVYPDRAGLNRTVDRQLHLGYNKIEKLYARAESFTSSLGEHKDNILYSLKNLNLFGGGKEK